MILERLAKADQERRVVALELQQLAADPVARKLNLRALKATLRGYVDDWHAMIRGNVGEARKVLEVALRDRIRFRPAAGADGAPSYELTAPVAFDRLLSAIVPSLTS